GVSVEEPRGADLGSALGRLRALAKDVFTQEKMRAAEARQGFRLPGAQKLSRLGPPREVTLRDLDALRQSIDEIADFNKIATANRLDVRISGRDEREAKLLRTAFRKVYAEVEPAFDRGTRIMSILRRVEKTLDPVVSDVRSKMDRGLLESMLQDNRLRRRLKTFQATDPLGYSAFQGHYLARFLEEAFTRTDRTQPTERVLVKTMDRMFRGTGNFRRELFDRILGSDVRQHFEDIATVEARWAAGAGQAINSLTAARVGDAALIGAGLKAPEVLLDTLLDASHGRFESLGRRVAGASMAVVTSIAIRSMLTEGRLAQALNRLATGQTLTTPTTGAVALQRAQQLGIESGGPLPRLIGGGLETLNRLGVSQ
ncbi:MAG: hypothetical protein ACRD2L_00380, partial [Terriglobia bacterium]